jgi:transcriptional regulator with GAF, ATPase, and Fis domain
MVEASQLADTFVALADTLVDEYDVVDLMHRLSDECVSLLGAEAAGLLLADQRGRLQVIGASAERSRILELLQLEADAGPCLDCYRSGRLVVIPDLQREASRWPAFAAAATDVGFGSVYALPLRLRAEVIGTLNLFGLSNHVLDQDALRLAQGLADVATIGILHERAIRHSELLAEQLQSALTSRIVIEQAKGILAEHSLLDMDVAFDRLRAYARNHNKRLSAVASDVVERRLDIGVLLAG